MLQIEDMHINGNKTTMILIAKFSLQEFLESQTTKCYDCINWLVHAYAYKIDAEDFQVTK